MTEQDVQEAIRPRTGNVTVLFAYKKCPPPPAVARGAHHDPSRGPQCKPKQ